jgi:hypothetical protein
LRPTCGMAFQGAGFGPGAAGRLRGGSGGEALAATRHHRAARACGGPRRPARRAAHPVGGVARVIIKGEIQVGHPVGEALLRGLWRAGLRGDEVCPPPLACSGQPRPRSALQTTYLDIIGVTLSMLGHPGGEGLPRVGLGSRWEREPGRGALPAACRQLHVFGFAPGVPPWRPAAPGCAQSAPRDHRPGQKPGKAAARRAPASVRPSWSRRSKGGCASTRGAGDVCPRLRERSQRTRARRTPGALCGCGPSRPVAGAPARAYSRRAACGRNGAARAAGAPKRAAGGAMGGSNRRDRRWRGGIGASRPRPFGLQPQEPPGNSALSTACA